MIFLDKIFDNIQKNLFQWIVAVILLGLFQVRLGRGFTFTPLICLLAALIMIYPSLVPLSFDKLKKSLKNYYLIILSLVLNFVVSPALAWVIGYLFLRDNPVLWLGLILLSILPGGGMVTTWSLRSKADMPTTVGVVIFSLIAAILIVPGGLTLTVDQLHLEKSVTDEQCPIETISLGMASCAGEEINYQTIMTAVFFIIVIPLVLAYLTQIFLRKKNNWSSLKERFGKLSNVGLLIILYFLMALKSNAIIFKSPHLIWEIIFPLILFYLFNWLIVWIIYKNFYFNSKGRALVWGSYLKYITLALGLAISLVYQNSNLSLVVMVVVFSYFIQIPTAFWLADYWKNKEKGVKI